jgi:hypothetical protein
VAINVWMAYSRQAGDWFVAGSATNLDLLVALPAPRTRMRVNVRKAGLDTHQIRVLADQLTGTRGCWLEDLRGGISDKLLLHVIERRQNMNEDDVDEDEDEDDEEEPMMMKRPAVPRKERVKRQAKAAAKAVGQGAVMVATNEFGNLALNIVKEKAATVPWLAAALEDPEGREVIKLVVALSVHTLAHQTDLMPKSEAVARVAEMQITMSSMQLIAPYAGLLRELGEKFAGIGELAERADRGFLPKEEEAPLPREGRKRAVQA